MSTSTTTEVMPPPDAASEESPKRSQVPNRWFLATDTVHTATETLPNDQKDMLRWLQRYAASRNLPPTQIAAMILKPNAEPYSPATIYQVLTGRRTEQGVSVKQFSDAVAAMRRRISETESVISSAFVQTRTTKKIWAVCGASFSKRRVGFIFGPPQVGKTTALTEYARLHNHGETILVRMPTRGALTHFLAEIAARVQVPSQRREDETRRRIFDCFDDRTLLVVDEAHQCLLGRGDSGAMTLEFIREIHDRRKCGVVICGTNVLQDQLQHNKILRQLWLRRSPGMVLNLTSECHSPAELAKFAAAFDLDPAPDSRVRVTYTILGEDGNPVKRTHTENPAELQTRILTTDGLGAWCKLLEDASDLARGSRMSWGKVIIAYCLAQAAEMPLADAPEPIPAQEPASPEADGGAA